MPGEVPTTGIFGEAPDSAAPKAPSKAEPVSFHGYCLENVYLRTTPGQRSEVLALWASEGLGSEAGDVERHSREAVFLVRSPKGELAGFSSASVVRVKGDRRFYSYTMLLRKRDRIPYLMLAVLNGTRDFLRAFAHPLPPVGMLFVTENRKLMRPGMRKLFIRHGYRFRGRTRADEDVWAAEWG